ncbi:hypothetical protein WMY93_002221 [Mugilogobius chulae]|uniref:Thyroglobulin type-1 domain-containing protein n=1 Tax=Mugilogobius chulae TaxID=88201 RepID=A0AAW0PV70_9GOBI
MLEDVQMRQAPDKSPSSGVNEVSLNELEERAAAEERDRPCGWSSEVSPGRKPNNISRRTNDTPPHDTPPHDTPPHDTPPHDTPPYDRNDVILANIQTKNVISGTRGTTIKFRRTECVSDGAGPSHGEVSKITTEDHRGPLENLSQLKFPNCDRFGLYNIKQCNMSLHGQRGECWCVDPLTGQQIVTSPPPAPLLSHELKKTLD